MAFIKDKLKKIIQDLLKDEDLKKEVVNYVNRVARDTVKEQLQKQIDHLG